MKTFKEFITEAQRKIDPKEWILVAAFNQSYETLKEEVGDAMLPQSSAGDPDLFLLTIEDAKAYADMKDIEAYELPASYTNIKDIEDDFENGDLTIEDLKKVDLKKI